VSQMRKVWVRPLLHVLGDVQTLTQQASPGPPCLPAVKKGHGSGDTFSNSQINDPNPNTGCEGASGL
jgi:hypothetical protein